MQVHAPVSRRLYQAAAFRSFAEPNTLWMAGVWLPDADWTPNSVIQIGTPLIP